MAHCEAFSRRNPLDSDTLWPGIVAGVAATGFTMWAGLRLLRQSRACSLRGKSVLITGGSRGLGLVLARELLAEGARIAICARDERELSAPKRSWGRDPRTLSPRRAT